MIDIHQHLVWGVDDGSEDPGTSIAMLHRAHHQGVTHIICTSHTAPGRREIDPDRYQKHLEQLRSMAMEEGLQIQLYTGAEIMFTSHAVQALRDGRALTLAGSRYVLVEFLPDTPHDMLLRGLMDLSDAGYHPVLAHGERYTALRQRDRLAQLKRTTRTLIQMNASTVLRAGRILGDSWSRRMLKQGVIDLVASDAHHHDFRPCLMGDARQTVIRLTDEPYANDLFSLTPAMILEDGRK